MNLRDLEYLVAVADHRQFSRAAAACYVSQPTLSTQLRKLERELGTPLLERTSGGVLLTAAGEAIVGRARVVLAQVDEIRALAGRAADPRAGVLSLGMFPTLGPYLLPHVMPALRRAMPQLRVQLVEEKSAALLEGLRQGRLDAVLLALPFADEGLSVEPLFREEFVLAVPADHPVPEPAPASALAGSEVLLLDEGHCLRDQALAVCSRVGADESGFRATSLETLRHMVAAGAGTTLLPRLAVAGPVAEPEGLRLVEMTEPRPFRDVALAWRPTSPVADLMPALAAVLRSGPGDLVRPLP